MPDCQLPTLGWEKTASQSEHFHPFLINILETWHLNLLYSAGGAFFSITFHEKFYFYFLWNVVWRKFTNLFSIILTYSWIWGDGARKAVFRTFHGSSNGKETCESITNPEANVPMNCLQKKNYSCCMWKPNNIW